MSRPRPRLRLLRRRFPRVSGDEPNREIEALLDPEFSPRERG